MSIAQKRAEARTRYYVRDESQLVGWDVRHPARGGMFLEEQEIVDYFPELKFALKDERPDFVCLLGGRLRAVIECKNDWKDLSKAVREAQDYADTINRIRGYQARIAIGVAGTPDKRVQIRCTYKYGSKWVELTSHEYPLTQIPTPAEMETALANANGTTDVQLPNEREFFSAAISISRMLRLAKIEEALRPKVIGAVILALYHGEFSLDEDVVIENINTNVKAAIKSFIDVPKERRDFLAQTLELSTEAHRLRPKIGDIIHQLERLNVRSIMRSGVDFLGQFYETFLRYGQDTKKLGIVFTPRHITRFCAEIIDVKLGNTVYDPACGTGGFLVAAFDRMMKQATTPAAQKTVKESLYGFDTNATVWALAVLNMFFRGDGKSHIANESCFDGGLIKNDGFDCALLNPPFSQEGEPETDFIDNALNLVKPGGRIAVVVKTSVMVDSDLRRWREALIAEHHVEAVITLPLDLFYPTAAPTVILIVKAYAPNKKRGTFLARVANDGFEISKKRRVPIEGDQLPQVLKLFRQYERSGKIDTIPNLAMVINREQIIHGEEICAEQWLPSGEFSLVNYEKSRKDILKQMSLTVANYPDVVDELLDNYEAALKKGRTEGRPTERTTLSHWFNIQNGKSSGSKTYPPGLIPYVSSGEGYSGIIDFLETPEDEVYTEPCVSVSCFGPANVQPWRFAARGNGGSAVRILKPKFSLTVPELLWFVGQVNFQRWRYHFGRMALPSRLGQLEVDPPPKSLPKLTRIKDKLMAFRRDLYSLIESGEETEMEIEAEECDAKIARHVLTEIESSPDTLIAGKKLTERLNEILS